MTARERDILHWIADGKSCQQTAIGLGISAFTVRKHRCHILTKLGLHSTAQLVAAAIAAYPCPVDVSGADTHSPLSPRECQVVSLIAEGLTSKQVARRIDISPATVRKHRENAAKKLRLHGLSALVRRWIARERRASKSDSGYVIGGI